MRTHKSIFYWLSPMFFLYLLAGEFRTAYAAHPECLVSPDWVKSVQDFQVASTQRKAVVLRPATFKNTRFVILEVSWSTLAEAKDYHAGHVPEALHFNTDEFENGYPRWHLKPLSELQQVIGKYGITRDTTVVVYSQQPTAAARVWWVLSYAGVADVRILNGGYAAWLAAGYTGETTTNSPYPVAFTAPAREDWIATTAYVRERFDKDSVWLADARSQAEYRGEVSGYDYLLRRGRIPGAVHIGDADDKAQIYLEAEGRLRPRKEIETLWAEAGLKAGKPGEEFEREVIFYCGSGWRSSLTFFYAYMLGYKNIRNYSDGWSGWSTTYVQDAAEKGLTPGWRQDASGNPIATGQD
jgi:3-mercaptopyruvate sulfurtransferase SseA